MEIQQALLGGGEMALELAESKAGETWHVREHH